MAEETLVYGGIKLSIVQTLMFEHTPVYDSLDTYLYTRIIIVVSAVYNPDATSYVKSGASRPAMPTSQVAPAVQPLGVGAVLAAATNTAAEAARQVGVEGRRGSMPAITENAIRHVLSQPRQQLIYANGDTVMIRSPTNRAIVDSANGPRPLESPSVTQIFGTKTFLVRFAVETSINECPATRRRRGILLSHVWEQSEDIDQDYYITRQTHGRMIFDSARMNLGNVTPDDFRSISFQPIPAGFKRLNIQVTATEDGNSLVYSFIDKQQTLTIGETFADTVSRIEAVQTAGAGLPDFISATIGNLGFNLLGGVDLVGRLASEDPRTIFERAAGTAYSPIAHALLSRFGGAALQVIGGIPGLGGLATTIMGLVGPPPVTTHSVVVRVWGNQGSDIDDLSNAAYWVVTYRLSRITPAAYAINCRESRDAMGNFVEVHVDYTGPGITFNLNSETIGNPFPRLRDYFTPLRLGHYKIPTDVQVPAPQADGPIDLTWSPFPAPVTPVGRRGRFVFPIEDARTLLAYRNAFGQVPYNQTRGSYIGKLVTQMLASPCSVPGTMESFREGLFDRQGSEFIVPLPAGWANRTYFDGTTFPPDRFRQPDVETPQLP